MQKLIRRCVQCRSYQHRDLMFRLYARQGLVALGQPDSGRSLYLCKSPECLKRAMGNKSILRFLPGVPQSEWQSWCQAHLQQLTPKEAD